MRQKININIFLHSLLVTQKMNEFTVIEARDVLLNKHTEFSNVVEARKYIYRQLLWGIKNDLLKRTNQIENGKKKVIYSKTDTFFAATFIPVKRLKKKIKNNSHKIIKKQPNAEVNNYKELLEKELITYEIDLTASLEEAKEYKRLSARFPELNEKLQHHHLQAKKQSTQLLGRIHALQKLLGYTVMEPQSC